MLLIRPSSGPVLQTWMSGLRAKRPSAFFHLFLSALLSIHRPFLSMALLQHPGNPFESTYPQSVLAAQNAASFIIRTTARYMEKASESILRHWDVWVDVSSAAVSIHP